ncbi:MAG: T9SS type A sorting domain-containing protein [bacterium]|nr:T9SS type A sorting domain-containing protein [bacterium]
MKKIILLLLILFSSSILFSYDYHLQKDDGSFDFYWYGNVRRSVKYYLSDTCTLKVVYWGRYTKRDEIDTILVFNDNSGIPGTTIYSDTHLVNTNSYPLIVSDTVVMQVLLCDTFYVGLFSRCQDQPSNALAYFISDSTPSFNSFWDSIGTWVVQTEGDYIIRAKVSGPEGISLRLYEENIQGGKEKDNNFKICFENYYITLSNIKHFKIIDRSGRKIIEGSSKSVVIDLTKMKSGIYFLMVKDLKNKTYTKKITKL